VGVVLTKIVKFYQEKKKRKSIALIAEFEKVSQKKKRYISLFSLQYTNLYLNQESVFNRVVDNAFLGV
jgi:hypothetical protein